MATVLAEGFPLSKDKIEAVCDPKKYGNKHNFPYINYLPFTKPSKEYIEFAKEMLPNRVNWQTQYRDIKDFRALWDEFNVSNINDPNSCTVSEFNINNKFDNNTVNGHVISYSGSSINNGVIIMAHGGCYCILSDRFYFGFAELVSKLTGCVVYTLNYKLAPQYPLPSAVNEMIMLYQYVLNDLHVPCSTVSMIGSSCGGGMILLALQSIKYGAKQQLNLPQPACVWLCSPWANLENNSKSYFENKDTELLMALPVVNQCADWAVGKQNISDKRNEIYSPINGKFNGLAPMYIMVGAGEILLDDSLVVAKKAFECGVNVKLDIEPFMMHVWPDFVNIFNEAFIGNAKGAEWILSHFKKFKTSKL